MAGLVGLAALVWPLVLSLLVGSVAATVVIYALALTIDVVLFVLWLLRAIGYSKQAARGATFEVPIVAAWDRRLHTKR
ncbi:MAG TPA: hypothetical protein VIG51_11850 [Candidatus Baltobacteraceae bacterium]